MRRILALSVGVLSLFNAAYSSAEDLSPNTAQELRSQIESLQTELRELKALLANQQKSISEISKPASAPLTQQPKTTEFSNVSSKLESKPLNKTTAFLPDIGLVGDIVGSSSETLEREEGNDRFSVREVELVLGSDVDPYSRLDGTLSFSDFEEVEIEELYATYWGLPAESRLRLGRFHQNVGKAAALHRDSLDTVDAPWVVQRFLGEHGIHRSGFDLTLFTPLSQEHFTQQLYLGLMEGGNAHGSLLFGEERDKPSAYARLSHFWDISELSNLEIGANYLGGADQDNSSFGVHVGALDLSYIRHFDSTRRLKLQSEFFYQSRGSTSELAVEPHELAKEDHEHDEHSLEAEAFRSNSSGVYALADYRLAKRWALGVRYDWVEPLVVDEQYSRSADEAWSAYLSFFQSEFARLRFQYQYAQLAEGKDDNRFFLQATFAIGTHKHQLQ